jgi:hypothetical protein
MLLSCFCAAVTVGDAGLVAAASETVLGSHQTAAKVKLSLILGPDVALTH